MIGRGPRRLYIIELTIVTPQEAYTFLSVLNYVFNLSTAAVYLPLTLAEEVRLGFMELISPHIVRMKLVIANNFGPRLATGCNLLSLAQHLLLYCIVVATHSLLRVEEGALSLAIIKLLLRVTAHIRARGARV